MNIFTRFIFLFLTCIALAGCLTVPNELKIAEQLIETAPDSALQILRELPPQKYKKPKNRALYGLLMIQALDKKQLALKPDSLLDFSIAYYQEYPDNDRLASCYLYRGRTYKYYFQYEKAIELYLKALETIHSKNNHLLLARINSDLGDIYLVQGEYMKARKKYKLAYKYLQNEKLYNYAYYSLIDIGKTYYMLKDYDIAQKYFRYVFIKAKDSLTIGAALHETGLCYYQSNHNDSAISYFRKVLHYPYIGCNKAVRYYYLGNIFYKLNTIDSAFYYAKESFNFKPDIRTQRECYRILTNSEFLKGNMQSMSEFMNKYVQLGDSLRKIDTQTKGSVLETMHITRQEIKKTESRFKYLFMLLFLLISAAVFIYIRKHRLNQQERLHTEKEAEQIRLRQRIDIRKHEIEKHLDILLKKINEKKTFMASERKNATITEKETMDIEIYNELLHFNNRGLFYREMDTLLNNTVTKLKTGYPNLNDKEITWCCLYLLQIPASDMFLLLDYKVNGLKKMRQRLALKMNLQGVAELYILLDKMLYD